ncbi:MAG TPA: hypothetical protein VKA55_07660 [Gammaproteobacteria bacterium]|nr:hypothetical protein [Gammaproteobacteria bacterium]
MGRIPKGVVTLGVTFAPSRHAVAGGAWHIDPAGTGGAAMACPAEGHDSPELIHELLDHWIPGFATGGMVGEAKAVVQQAARTGSDPVPALGGLVDALLRPGEGPQGRLRDFLPADLLPHLPRKARSDEEDVRLLRRELGDGLLRARLLGRLVDVGWQGFAPARAVWIGRGLDFRRRHHLADSLHGVVDWMGRAVRDAGWDDARGELALADDMVRFRFHAPGVWEWAREVRPP